MDPEVAEFARQFRRFMSAMHEVVDEEDEGEPLRAVLDAHLGRDARRLPVVADRYAPFEHVNVQVAVDALLEQPGREHRLVGLLGDQHSYMSFADIARNAHRRGVAIGAVDFVSLPDGPGSTRLCVQSGLYLIDDDGTRVALLLRGGDEEGPHPSVTVEALAADRDHAERIVAELRRLSLERSVFRNQVLTFAEGRYGEPVAGPIAFQERPRVAREEVILPERTFAAIEQHVFGIASHRERLLASGMHVKRGLLLHGPPGTGKTLTARYLIGRLVDHTVVVLSGPALHYIDAAAKLARALQPALVVLEDVDLVAQERMPYLGHASPVLFTLLNVMDGLDSDADITFLLTTNRADVLEPALAARPGRVDQAVEIALPDADARRRLLELYGARANLRLADVDAVVARTEGVTASFVKELVRKAGLAAAEEDGDGPLTLTDEHVNRALDVLLAEGAHLTRALLGIPPGEEPYDDDEPGPAPAPSGPGWFAYAPLGRRPPRRF